MIVEVVGARLRAAGRSEADIAWWWRCSRHALGWLSPAQLLAAGGVSAGARLLELVELEVGGRGGGPPGVGRQGFRGPAGGVVADRG